MNTFFKKKIITPFIGIIIAVVAVSGTLGVNYLISSEKPANEQTTSLSSEQLYEKSVEDAMQAEQDEIKPLVLLTKDSEDVTWNETGDKILLLSWHKYPDSYKEGETTTLSYGAVWTFTDKEMIERYKENSDTTDWKLRFQQLIGLPPESEYTHFTAFWAKPEDVYRPAYVTDITKSDMTNSFGDNVDEEYKSWFDGNIVYSYYDSAYPWTRLGYTYDWADNDTEYGLSEFLIKKDSEVQIEFTKTTEEFTQWLKTK